MNRPALALALLSLLVAPSAAPAQQRFSPEFLRGSHIFRYILNDRGCTPLQRFEDWTAEPDKTILIVFGDTHILDKNLAAVLPFVENGGSLFVATDHAATTRFRVISWASYFGVEFHAQPVLAPPNDCYQQLAECPWVFPADRADPPLFAGLSPGVAVNRAGFLRRRRAANGKFLSALAKFPEGSTHGGNLIQPDKDVFAVGGKWGGSRVLFLADHSVFINNMMIQPDTGNATFAYECLDWLRDSPRDRARDRVLFYDDGNLITNFNVPLTFPPPQLPPDPVAMLNHLIVGLEREDMHNRFLGEYIGFDKINKFLVIGLTALLAVYLFWRLRRSRHAVDAAAPLLAPTLARLAPAGTGLAPRHKALLAEGNLWEPARALARDFFETALGTPEPLTGPPPFQSSDSWLTRRFLDRLLKHLWRLAYGRTPERIAPASFAHLAAQVDELKAALADGSLRFQITPI